MLNVCLHINWFKRPYTTSKLDQFATVKCTVVITNNPISIHAITLVYHESWAREIVYSSEDRRLHYVDIRRMPDNIVEISYSRIGLSITDIKSV